MLIVNLTWMSEMLLEMSGPLEPPNTGNSAFVPNCSCASQTSSKSLQRAEERTIANLEMAIEDVPYINILMTLL